MSFRLWVAEHSGQSVRVEWESFSLGSSGGARVVLAGFDEAAEERQERGVLLAVLQELEGTNRVGLIERPDGTVPIMTLAPQIQGLLSEGQGSEVVCLAVQYLKRVEATNGDLVICSMYERFQVDYEYPDHAEHGDLSCPIHDEPLWRDGC